MNYILHQLEESIEQIIQLFNSSSDICYKMLHKLMIFIIDENNNQEQYHEKTDLLNLIYNLKNHLKQNPHNRVRLLIAQQERKLGDVDEIDLDLHKKCKKELKELTDKLNKRDQIIRDQTANYTREIQHLTEQIYRLSNVQENLENHQFDRNQIKDQATLDLINKNFEKISHSYENKMRRLDVIIEAQKKELLTCKQHLKDLKQKCEYHQQPEYLVRKLGQLEKDPYKMWKHFQEFYGNLFLLQVFKHQKNGYGINYKEIDEILSQSKIIERELQLYQRLIETSLAQFMEKLTLNAQKEKEASQQREMEFFTSLQNQQQLSQNIISIYSKSAQSWKRYTNTILLKYAIQIWKGCDQHNKQSCIKYFMQTLAQVKLQIDHTDFAVVYHNQHIQLQSKYNWSQKLNTSITQNLSKVQFQKDHLENLLNNLKQQYGISIDKKGITPLKLDQNYQKEVLEKVRQHNIELSYSEEYLNGGKSDQFTQTETQFFLPLESTPIKVQMHNELLQSQLSSNTEVKITVMQTENRKEVHSSQRNTVTNFDILPSKTPQLKTFSQPTSSLDSNLIDLKPKFLNLRCVVKPVNQQNENGIQENKVNSIINNSRKYQKVDLLKQVQILNNLQHQLKKIDSQPDQCQQLLQNKEKGYRTAIKRQPNLSITFEEFNKELIVDPLEIFSSTQRQNKIRRHSTKNSEYLIF